MEDHAACLCEFAIGWRCAISEDFYALAISSVLK
jgi:hypothetical protein